MPIDHEAGLVVCVARQKSLVEKAGTIFFGERICESVDAVPVLKKKI